MGLRMPPAQPHHVGGDAERRQGHYGGNQHRRQHSACPILSDLGGGLYVGQPPPRRSGDAESRLKSGTLEEVGFLLMLTI